MQLEKKSNLVGFSVVYRSCSSVKLMWRVVVSELFYHYFLQENLDFPSSGFSANADASTVIHHTLPVAVKTTKIRLIPVTWYNLIGLAGRIYGYKPGTKTQNPVN